MLVPVGREKPGDGRRFQGNFPPQDGTDKAPDRAVCRFKGTIKRGKGENRGAGFRETSGQKPQLGGGTASVDTFKNGKIVYT
jgi:hypothetical protein